MSFIQTIASVPPFVDEPCPVTINRDGKLVDVFGSRRLHVRWNTHLIDGPSLQGWLERLSATGWHVLTVLSGQAGMARVVAFRYDPVPAEDSQP